MKKLIILLLIGALALSICGCSENSSDFQVGFAMVDITPEEAIPMGGYGTSVTRLSTGSYDPLYTTAVAMSDGKNTLIMIENDLINSHPTVCEETRNRISAETGIPVEQIMLASSHTHSGPDLGVTSINALVNYRTELVRLQVKAALAALEDLKPATMYAGDGIVEGLNFVRHYNTSDGGVRGDNFGMQYNNELISHTHEADHQMQVVRFVREGGKDVVMVNWQVHPHRAGARDNTNITSDIVGSMRDRIMEKLDCNFMYYTGAAGNINPTSYIDGEDTTSDYITQGRAMADAAIGILDSNMQPLQTGTIETIAHTYTGNVDHSMDEYAGIARQIYDEWARTYDHSVAIAAGRPYNINGAFHAQGIFSKASMADTHDIELYVHSIGQLAFINAPYEMFDEHGIFIKENSPYEMTFIVTCSNAANQYIPTAEAYDYNCYEANTGKFERGTGEILQELYVKLLNDLYK